MSEAKAVQVQLGERLIEFTSEQHWINSAQGLFNALDRPSNSYLVIDSDGRICTRGGHFMRATKENTYPITVYDACL